ncbi:aspartyl/asparaginyl beta-hydroxylase domain-containing protein [Diaphorobacter sp.]|uniref:aspartyl/asparaginyl beta-hydroxylase domain-containing protein n=1 Tax=Diaphorobacter sp. TaxID=1934310 RepID=UPI00289F4ABE|nr:aspartyl/asparaginyl beta-hydroxylase domain-containing protein [Diaphorobacter sp.]
MSESAALDAPLAPTRALQGPLYARLGIFAPVAALQAEVSQLMAHDWLPHVNRADYDGAWDVLPLRCQRRHVDAHPILQGFALSDPAQDWDDLPVLRICPAIRQLLDRLACPLKSVRLMRLHAGASIRPHRDHGLHLGSGEARLHAPVWTNPDVHFYVAGQEVPMREGELWYFNADEEHAVVNHSRTARTHLVMDCVTNPWLVRRIQEGAFGA